MMRQCVILVGGKGLRLGELTKNTPKPMLKINGSPFLLQILNMAQRFGFRKILLLASIAATVLAKSPKPSAEINKGFLNLLG